MRILLLLENPNRAEPTHAMYTNGLRRLGHDVYVGTVHSLGWNRNQFVCDAGRVSGEATIYGPIPRLAERLEPRAFDLVWLLNQPHPRVAADVWQLLWRLNCSVPFVNDITGLLMLNNKNNLPLVVPEKNLPGFTSSCDEERLLALMEANPKARWILKRANGGCGADVFVLAPDDTNRRALVQSLTGNAPAVAEMADPGLTGLRAQHALLQDYVEHSTEKRIAICGGKAVAAQEKRLPNGDHRGNMAQHAAMTLSAPTPEESHLAEIVGARLLRYGVRFAGLDMAFPYVFEINLVNPGGLTERLELGLDDPQFHASLELLLSDTLRPAIPTHEASVATDCHHGGCWRW